MTDITISMKYKRKGQVQIEKIIYPSCPGSIQIGWKDNVEYLNDEQLKNLPPVLDLTSCPVVVIGKGRQQRARLQDFLEKSPNFRGCIYLAPYSWCNGWSDGTLMIGSWDILNGKKISGGRPEEKLVNHRFDLNGKYLCDRGMVLRKKTVKLLEENIVSIHIN